MARASAIIEISVGGAAQVRPVLKNACKFMKKKEGYVGKNPNNLQRLDAA
jgi:hypothetical protein